MSFSFDASMCRNNIAVQIYGIYVKNKQKKNSVQHKVLFICCEIDL